ncbi:MAG: methyl-accepting chemotaxis protein [Candidatus Moduliflexus flocculans]|nr:methyl-accepting chemotaxis protein [Candidatus Moduliflexus flocculans]
MINIIILHQQLMMQQSSFYDVYSQGLDELIEIRINNFKKQIPLAIFFTFSTLVIILYLFAAFYFSVINGIQAISNEIKNIANGDLSTVIKIENNDEIGDLAKITNTMTMYLNNLVKQVVSSSEEVSAGSQQMHGAADQTAQGAVACRNNTTELMYGIREISKKR